MGREKYGRVMEIEKEGREGVRERRRGRDGERGEEGVGEKDGEGGRERRMGW